MLAVPRLFPYNLDQDTLPAPAVKLAVKDLPPRAKDFDELSRVVQPPVGDRHDDLAAHHLSLQMGVAVVPSTPLRTGLAGAIVAVAADRLVGGSSSSQSS